MSVTIRVPKVDAELVNGQTPGAALGPVMTDTLNKVPLAQIPAAAITDVYVVADQAEMLALDAGVGDVAKRLDLSKSFILMALPASTLGNWIEMSGDYEPAGAVATHTAIASAHHARYTDGEADARVSAGISTHSAIASAHHTKYTDGEALASVVASPPLTQGSIPFADAAGKLTQDTKIYWDNVNKRLGIGTNTPAQALDLVGNLLTQGQNILGGVTYPRADAVYALGSPAWRWSAAYISGNIIIDGLVDGIDVSTIPSTYEPIISPKNTAFNKNFGSGTGTICEGNDTRLSDARTPLAHNQGADTITTGTLDGDRLPGFSTTKKAGVPATGTPSGKYLKDDGTWNTPSGGGIPTIIHGNEEAEDTTTLTSLQQAYRFSPTLEVAKYLVTVSWEMTNSSSGGGVEARCEIDDTTEIVSSALSPVVGDEYCVRSGHFLYDCPSAAVHNIDIDFRRLGMGGTAKIRRKRITLMKVVV